MSIFPFRTFQAPSRSLGQIDSDGAAKLIAAASDLALVVDGDGVIRDVAFGSDEFSQGGYGSWIGRRWTETVTTESRPKIEALIKDAGAQANPRARQVNHPLPHGADLPILYSALRVGDQGNIVALGRDLRAISTAQQRLVEAQNSMERDYARLRHAQTRYRILFQMIAEAILIMDASSQTVVEANPAAAQLLGTDIGSIVGRTFPLGFELADAQSVQQLLSAVRSGDRGYEVPTRVVDGDKRCLVSASLFQQENTTHFLVRLSMAAGRGAALPMAESRVKFLEVMEQLPDAFVVTDLGGRVLAANRAFLDLAELASEGQVRGESLERWLGRAGADLNVLIAGLRRHGSVRLFATKLRGEYGAATDIEISAVAVLKAEPECLGFAIRDIGRRPSGDGRAGRDLPRSVEQLTELVGRVSLKELVQESTDLVEKLCIEAALKLTGDNRASAAEVLGLSRQSLYVKLRRHGLGDLAAETES